MEKEHNATLDLKGREMLQGYGEYFVTTRECLSLSLEGLKIDSIGLRVATEDHGKIHPTVHAVQLLYQTPKKTIELDEEQTKKFIKNQEIETQEPDGGYIITNRRKPVDAGQVRHNKLRRI